MANGIKILVIGRHPGLMENVLGMLRQQGYEATGALTNEEALRRFDPGIQAVIIGGGVDGESRRLFRKEFLKINPAVKVIDGHPHTILSDLRQIIGQ